MSWRSTSRKPARALRPPIYANGVTARLPSQRCTPSEQFGVKNRYGHPRSVKPPETSGFESPRCTAVDALWGGCAGRSHGLTATQDSLVRSEGGRICCDFNGLRKWAKSLGAFPAHKCFSSGSPNWLNSGRGAVSVAPSLTSMATFVASRRRRAPAVNFPKIQRSW